MNNSAQSDGSQFKEDWKYLEITGPRLAKAHQGLPRSFRDLQVLSERLLTTKIKLITPECIPWNQQVAYSVLIALVVMLSSGVVESFLEESVLY